MGVKDPMASEPLAAPLQRPKARISAKQRKRWQLGTPVTAGQSKGPMARGSCDLPDTVVQPALQQQQQRSQQPGIAEALDEGGGSSSSTPFGKGAVQHPAPVATDSARTSASQHPAAAAEFSFARQSPTASSASDARSPEEATPRTPQPQQSPRMTPPPMPDGFSGPAEMNQLEADISPFRRIQEGDAKREAGAAAQQGASGAQASPDMARAGSQGSVDSVDSTADEPMAPWRSFRQRQVSAALPPGDVLSEQHKHWQQQQQQKGGGAGMQREASIAFERRGIHAERAGRGGRDPGGITHRIREVQLDPKAGGIWVDRQWRAKEGQHLTEDLVLGKVLGSGFQAHVYELLDAQGRVAPIVLKAARQVALISDTQREWATGQRLAALGPGDAPLPGIMKIGPAVCRGRKRGNKGTKLIGMVMERINGKSVDKIITASDFHDIYYIREMLHEVFTSLDATQRAFGFHHYDLRLDNVMEHTPDPEQDAADPVSKQMLGDASGRSSARKVYKIIDFGLGRFDEYYPADEGADGNLDVGEPEGNKKAPWYTAPIRWCGSAPEAVHHVAWRGKGDVYHLLFDLSQKIHGRVWPERDRAAVKRLLSLIRHVCGVKPTATFSSSAEGAVVNCLPVVPVKLPNACLGVPAADRLGLRRRRRTFVHKSYLLRWALQLKAWQFPSNPGLTASEVLTSPFFR